MFGIGEKIVYGNMGVCCVAGFEEKLIDGEKRLYYILEPMYQRCKVTTPVGSDKVSVRPIITDAEASELIRSIPNVEPVNFPTGAVRQLTEYYESILKTNDCAKLLRLAVSIHRKKRSYEEQKRKFGMIDEKYMKRTDELLLGELAAALETSMDDVREHIVQMVENCG